MKSKHLSNVHCLYSSIFLIDTILMFFVFFHKLETFLKARYLSTLIVYSYQMFITKANCEFMYELKQMSESKSFIPFWLLELSNKHFWFITPLQSSLITLVWRVYKQRQQRLLVSWSLKCWRRSLHIRWGQTLDNRISLTCLNKAF